MYKKNKLLLCVRIFFSLDAKAKSRWTKPIHLDYYKASAVAVYSILKFQVGS